MKHGLSQRNPIRVALVLCIATGLGCATTGTNYYRAAASKQEACCNSLADAAARNACLKEIPRISSTAAETSTINSETFQCVERHFECNAATGRATKDSAQSQLDCIQDLESSRQMPQS